MSYPFTTYLANGNDRRLHKIKMAGKIRRVWRYQRGNQNPYIEVEQTTQWPKEQVQKDKQRSTKHRYKTKDRVTRTPLKLCFWSTKYAMQKFNVLLCDLKHRYRSVHVHISTFVVFMTHIIILELSAKQSCQFRKVGYDRSSCPLSMSSCPTNSYLI
jgi:hypothetical protein